MRIHKAAMLLVCSLAACPWSLPAEDQKPWEKPPDSTISPAGTTGHDKIETVIQTTGGTREDGAQVSTAGTSSQQSYVNGFLNDAATKIKEAGGGSGWAWSWEKKWKIGPDGKPHEVKETWVDGSIGLQSRPAVTGSPAPSTPVPAAATPQTPAPTGTSANAKNPATPPSSPAQPVPTAAKTAAAATPQPAASGQPSQPSQTAAIPAPKGVDVAPVKIAPPPILLTIFDPVSQQESSFAAAVNPSKPGRVPLVASISRPIYEDTRVKMALDLGPGINRSELSVTIRDNEGDHAFERGAFPENYRHIFRVPNQHDYTAAVVYEHPISKERQEIIHVQIPVLKMSFANRTVEDSTRRTDDPESSTSGSGSTAASGRGATPSGRGTTGWGASTGSTRQELSNSGDRATIDMSDLYTDPTNPPSVAGGESSTAARTPSSPAGTAPSAAIAGTPPGAQKNPAADSASQVGNDSSAAAGAVSAGAPSGIREDADRTTSASPGGSASGDSGDTPGAQPDQSGSESAAGQGTAAGGSDSPAGTAAATAGGSGADTASLQAQGAVAVGDAPAQATPANESGTAPQGGVTTAAVQQAAKPYLCSISIQNRATDGAQSFDFLEDPAPTAQSISPQTPLAFTFDCAKNVQQDSVKIEIFDGREKITTSLSKIQNNLVEHIFTNQTADAYIWVYGRTDQAPFSCKVMIPVTGL
ncbi:MAG TPA: hypothetical protein PKM25_09385 [Candidatus Ozemobacteraceae bacterium]|nr:hypothetical protein [Candidatus Ozemobacteraceae bacterium]